MLSLHGSPGFSCTCGMHTGRQAALSMKLPFGSAWQTPPPVVFVHE